MPKYQTEYILKGESGIVNFGFNRANADSPDKAEAYTKMINPRAEMLITFELKKNCDASIYHVPKNIKHRFMITFFDEVIGHYEMTNSNILDAMIEFMNEHQTARILEIKEIYGGCF